MRLMMPPNLLLEKNKATRCDEVWVGDITYLPLQEGEWGFSYLVRYLQS